MKALLERWRRRTRPAILKPGTLDLAGKCVTVAFRRHRRARRLIVRLDRSGRGVVVTLPPGVGRDEGLAFAMGSAGWIRERLSSAGDTVSFCHGAEFPLRGREVTIVHSPVTRGTVRFDVDSSQLHVAGAAEHVARRTLDWLKAEARRDLLAATEKYAAAMNVRFRRLTIRDQKSRWGSCASDGSLSYSWRLVMAPPQVLDYVAAHEVAHLRHMNHSVSFWRLVLGHCSGAHSARCWLRANSTTLHRYGRPI